MTKNMYFHHLRYKGSTIVHINIIRCTIKNRSCHKNPDGWLLLVNSAIMWGKQWKTENQNVLNFFLLAKKIYVAVTHWYINFELMNSIKFYIYLLQEVWDPMWFKSTCYKWKGAFRKCLLYEGEFNTPVQIIPVSYLTHLLLHSGDKEFSVGCSFNRAGHVNALLSH